MRKVFFVVGVLVTATVVVASYLRFGVQQRRQDRFAVLAQVKALAADAREGRVESLVELQRMIDDGAADNFSRIQAVESLYDVVQGSDPKLVKDVVAFLASSAPNSPRQLRASICRVLGSVGRQAAPAVQTVVLLAREGRGTGAAAACAKALGQIGDSSDPVVTVLASLISTSEGSDWSESGALGEELMALAALGTNARAAVPAVEKVLRHQNVSYRWKAVLAMSSIDPSNGRLVESATSLLVVGDQVARYFALKALSRVPVEVIRGKEASEKISAAACDAHPDNAKLARELLSTLGVAVPSCSQ